MSRDLFPREVAPEPGLAILLRHRDVEQCFCVTAIFVADVSVGSIASFWPKADDFRSSRGSRHRHGRSACLKRADRVEKVIFR
jgi:hypothetical protein